ncbi:MAG: hypothetical protein EON58_17295 [Alphaproteobacteria bacterium]|nr:MAG: hypothetical protein EON58_17295 [Alphaproteobacteria bacterium]
MFRDLVTAQASQASESEASGSPYPVADPGYRAIPKIAKDDDGMSASVVKVDRSAWGSTTCGLTGLLAVRLANCATVFGASAEWNGETMATQGQSNWKLVTRTGDIAGITGREVWQDQRTGLLWSSKVSTSTNWCKASGSNFISGNPAAEDDPNNYCDNSTYQNVTGLAISACYEDDGTYFTSSDASIDNGGKAGLGRASTPAVAWRLPTANDYFNAEVNGIRFVLPDMLTIGDYEWTATVNGNARSQAHRWYGQNGYDTWGTRSGSYDVRCVGR